MPILLRPSSFPVFRDCPRRYAARSFPVEIKDAGHRLHDVPISIGAPVGTATHAAIAVALNEKLKTGSLPTDDSAEQAAIECLSECLRTEDAQWDATTPDLNTAQKQVRRQYRIYLLTVAQEISPVAVERRISVQTKRGNTLSGQIDIMDDGIRDVKTGIVSRSNIAQYGGYSLLRRLEGGRPARIVEDFIRRVPLREEQPPPVTIQYDPALAERVAARTIAEIEEQYAEFLESGDPLAFPANPNSMFCSRKFCPAHGTSWCMEGRP